MSLRSDVQWKQDIWKIVRSSPCDYTFQINRHEYQGVPFTYSGSDEGNTGVYYAKPTRAVRDLFQQVANGSCLSPLELDDQTLFWNELRSRFSSQRAVFFHEAVNGSSAHPAWQMKLPAETLSFCPFDPYQIASGWAVRVTDEARKALGVLLVHANYGRRLRTCRGSGIGTVCLHRSSMDEVSFPGSNSKHVR